MNTFPIYKRVFDNVNNGLLLIDNSGKCIFLNSKMKEFLSRQTNNDNFVGLSIFDFMTKECKNSALRNQVAIRNGLREDINYCLGCEEKGYIFLKANVSIDKDESDQEIFIFSVNQITEVEFKRNLFEVSKSHYISLFEDSPVPIWDENFSKIKIYIDSLKKKGVSDFKTYFDENLEEVLKCSGMLIVNDINKAVVHLNEAPSKEYLMENFRELIDGNSLSYALIQLNAIANNLTSCEFDAVLKTFKGNKRHVHIKWSVVKGYEQSYKHVYLTTTDVTSRIKADNDALRASNREKELLLKEIHHRVKNNMQIIASLLKLQSAGPKEMNVEALLNNSLHRINSMALVHELLYQSKNFAQIDYGKYLEKLVYPLVESLRGKSIFTLELNTDDSKFNINTAIPLGLLINEILTNSLKHGFPDGENGKIYIRLKKKNYPNFELHIGDSGVGFEEIVNVDELDSLGMQLIESLADQLSGTMKRNYSEKGTHYVIHFEELGHERQEKI